MDHRLLITSQVKTKVRRLLQRLSNTSQVSMSENTPNAGEESRLVSVALDRLVFQKPDECLGSG